ncbi:hypothetical protein G6F56_000269 [Rhizopus delemar]|nr:hypothetical protein G6F56_000269 [Rhizopus delemar]
MQPLGNDESQKAECVFDREDKSRHVDANVSDTEPQTFDFPCKNFKDHVDIAPHSLNDCLNDTFKQLRTTGMNSFTNDETDSDNETANTRPFLPNGDLNDFKEKSQIKDFDFNDNDTADTIPFPPNDKSNNSEEGSSFFDFNINDTADTIPFPPSDSLIGLEEGSSFFDFNDNDTADTIPFPPNDSLIGLEEGSQNEDLFDFNINDTADTIPFPPNDSLNVPEDGSDIFKEIDSNSDKDLFMLSDTDNTLPHATNINTVKLGENSHTNDECDNDDGSLNMYLHSCNNSLNENENELHPLGSYIGSSFPFSASDTSDLLGTLSNHIHNTDHSSVGNTSPLLVNNFNGDNENTNDNETNIFDKLSTEPQDEEDEKQFDLSDNISYASDSDYGSDLLLIENNMKTTTPPDKVSKQEEMTDSASNGNKRKGSLLESSMKAIKTENNGMASQRPVTLRDFFFDKKHIKIGKESPSPSFISFGDSKSLNKYPNETKSHEGHGIDNSV